MFKQQIQLKAAAIRWRQFSRRGDAVFRSLGREIIICTLTVGTLLSVVPASTAAQTAAPVVGNIEGDTLSPVELDDVEVTAARVAMPMDQAARSVGIVSRQQIEAAAATCTADLLKQCAAVDVRQRGPFGIQTDISINGGTHDQIVILLNGVNISSPHTGHLAADLPIAPDDVERIEILQGAASRIYGTSAFSGAINIVTKKSTTSPSLSAKPLTSTLTLEGGSYGSLAAGGSVQLSTRGTYHHLSLGYQQSDGDVSNTDFQKTRAYYSGGLLPVQGLSEVAWQLGYSNMRYGASTFYSGKYPNQWEANERYTASISAKTAGKVSLRPSLYFNRAYDHYQLIKHSSTGENFHRTDVYGATLDATIQWAAGTTAIGAELRNEGILSTSLGKDLSEDLYVGIHGSEGYYTQKDNRTNLCYFLEHDLQLSRWTFSLGLMANMNTALDHKYRLYPGIDIAYRPAKGWRLFASFNMAQRMPTFTDLYYKSPTNEGNTGLQPEETTEWSVGTAWQTTGLRAEARLFYRHQRNMIDWVMTPADSANGYTTYHATNFKVDNYGANLSATLLPGEWVGEKCFVSSFSIDYAYIHQKRHDDVEVVAAAYALDYLRHKVTASLRLRLAEPLSATLEASWRQRMGSYVKYLADGTTANQGYHPYAMINAKVEWTQTHWQLYLTANNLTAHRYYDIGNVLQPGLWITAGVKVNI